MANIGVTRDGVVERTGFRLSWGAIFAGFIVATMIQITLSVLGVAVGFTTWDVGDPARDLGVGLGIWIALSALISLFLGGTIAGRLAGVLTRGDGALHGVVVWGVATLVNLWLLATGAGVILGGAFDILGRTVSAAAGVVGTGVTQAGAAVIGEEGLDAAAIEAEVEAVLRETRDPALDPDTLRADAAGVREQAVAGRADNRELAREIVSLIRQRGGQVDREAIINVVVARTELSRPEAERVATRVEDATEQVRRQLEAGAETAVGVAATATDYVGRAAWWTLLALLLGAAAAAGGAALTARE
jgi:hypothetical protein